MRDRNINNRNKHVIRHLCGRKSFARKRRDIKNQTGKLMKYATTPAVDATNAEVFELRSQVTGLQTQVQSLAGFIQQLAGVSTVQTSMTQPNLGTLLPNFANHTDVINPPNSQGIEIESNGRLTRGLANLHNQPNLTSILSSLANLPFSQGMQNEMNGNMNEGTSGGT